MSTPIANATIEVRVTNFVFNRDLAANTGSLQFTATKFLASGGVPTGDVIQRFDGAAPIVAATLQASPFAAAVLDPVTGEDLSKVSVHGVVLLLEQIAKRINAGTLP